MQIQSATQGRNLDAMLFTSFQELMSCKIIILEIKLIK